MSKPFLPYQPPISSVKKYFPFPRPPHPLIARLPEPAYRIANRLRKTKPFGGYRSRRKTKFPVPYFATNFRSLFHALGFRPFNALPPKQKRPIYYSFPRTVGFGGRFLPLDLFSQEIKSDYSSNIYFKFFDHIAPSMKPRLSRRRRAVRRILRLQRFPPRFPSNSNKKKTRRKWRKRVPFHLRRYIRLYSPAYKKIVLRITKNNFFLTLSTISGKTIRSLSSGNLGLVGSKRKQSYSISSLSRSLANFILNKKYKNPYFAFFFTNKPGHYVRTAINSFSSALYRRRPRVKKVTNKKKARLWPRLLFIRYTLTRPHSLGLRPPKKRYLLRYVEIYF